VRTSVRRITFAMASSYPYQHDFARAHAQLTSAAACWRNRTSQRPYSTRSIAPPLLRLPGLAAVATRHPYTLGVQRSRLSLKSPTGV